MLMNGRLFSKKSVIPETFIGLCHNDNFMTKINSSTLKNILKTMIDIRTLEEAIAEQYSQQKMRCPTHLSIGQESPPAVLSSLLTKEDQAVSTHRAHAHYIAKGGDIDALIAEIHGKVTGCSSGIGGSMHLIDKAVGFMGSTAIVGGTIPIGVGLALAKQIKKEPGIVVVYLGDAATEEGVFYEAANFAAVKKLPVLFVCENNLYSVYSPLACRQPKTRKIFELAQAIGLNSSQCDGNDIPSAYNELTQAVDNVRAGKGAGFIELSTYRWREHCGPGFDDHLNYRDSEEVAYWKDKDPIKQLTEHLLSEQLISNNELSALKTKSENKVAQAFKKALLAASPQLKNLEHLVYAK
jgi:pyruvate dehydrogenase E1 component alpha subunit